MTIDPTVPANETKRLEALWSLGILDTPPEERFDRFTRLAKRLFDVPVAFISLIDSDRQWFKSSEGLPVQESPRAISFCQHAILQDQTLVIADASTDERFRDSPLVRESGVRFYAGHPISFGNGLMLGTICVVDYKPRSFGERDQALLADLASMVAEEFLLHNVATIDELTGLTNRRGFLSIGLHAVALCRRLDRPATLMFFDLDGFKAVNDEYGHAEGDRVLRAIGELLLEAFRDSDVVARLGGDEFCVLLTGTNAENVHRPLENLRAAVTEEQSAQPYNVDYSVGTVTFDAERHAGIADLLEEADRLMYENKRERKSR